MTGLQLESKLQDNETAHIGPLALTPSVDEDYWTWRVKVSDGQAVVGFPKFSTYGIGFAQEEDWNTNLPFTCDTQMIWDHIKHNKGDNAISDEDCITAIHMIQEAAQAAKAAAAKAVQQ